jgi:hypothetical protein
MDMLFKIVEGLYFVAMFSLCISSIYMQCTCEIIALKKNNTSTDEDLKLINKILKEKRMKYEIIRRD